MDAMIRIVGKLLLTLFLALALVLAVPFSGGNRGASYAQSISFGFFYDSLAPYGRWVTVASYGEVWVPAHIRVGWQPYTVGHWEYTEFGWTWVSFDPWGDVPYHYGTWTFIGSYGWVWVPGYVWAPAWVTWSYSDVYIGWAPIPPSLSITFGGYIGPPVVVAASYYVFVPVHSFVGVDVWTARVSSARNVTLIRETRNVTNFNVVGGTVHNTAIPVSHVERAAHTRIHTRDISVVKTRPTRIEAAGRSKGEKFAVAGPSDRRASRSEERGSLREKRGGQIEEKGNRGGGREGVTSLPRGKDRESLEPRERKGGKIEGHSKSQDFGPRERKGGQIEEKSNHRGEPGVTSLPRGKDRSPSEPRDLGPREKKGGRIEEKANLGGGREAQHNVSPLARNDRRSFEPREAGPRERKGGQIEEKGKLGGERPQKQQKGEF